MTLLFNSVFWLGVSAIGCGIFGAGSGFRVGWRAAEGGGVNRGWGGWALGYGSVELRQFPNIP